MEENKSEVARLLQHIDETYQAAKNGLTGLASGTAKHEFITTKMERLGDLHENLVTLVGPDRAISILAETIWPPAEMERQPEA